MDDAQDHCRGESRERGGLLFLLTVWDDAGEEGELYGGEVVAAPAGLAVAREPEGVVAGLAARPHAAAHVAAHAACVCHTNTTQSMGSDGLLETRTAGRA